MKSQLPEKSKIISSYLSFFKFLATQYYGKPLHYLVLFGSYARGDFNATSVIDVLVVLDKIESEMVENANL